MLSGEVKSTLCKHVMQRGTTLDTVSSNCANIDVAVLYKLVLWPPRDPAKPILVFTVSASCRTRNLKDARFR